MDLSSPLSSTPHLVSCINPSTERKQQNHPSDPSAHIHPRGETPLRVLTGKLQCEVTPPEDGNLEPRYRNISSCVGKKVIKGKRLWLGKFEDSLALSSSVLLYVLLLNLM